MDMDGVIAQQLTKALDDSGLAYITSWCEKHVTLDVLAEARGSVGI